MGQRVSNAESGQLLLSTMLGEPDGSRVDVKGLPVFVSVIRRLLPILIEATLVPAALFYVFVMTVGTTPAIFVALGWSYLAIVRRVVTRQPVPGLLLLGSIGLAMRTLFMLLSGSTFIYFLQPIGTTVVLAAVFFGSLVFGRPLIARMATDFCPMEADIATRPRVARLFIELTVLWACVHLLTAATTLGLLVSLPVSTYVLLKTGACLSITTLAIVLTVVRSVRVANAEQLVFARAV